LCFIIVSSSLQITFNEFRFMLFTSKKFILASFEEQRAAHERGKDVRWNQHWSMQRQTYRSLKSTLTVTLLITTKHLRNWNMMTLMINTYFHTIIIVVNIKSISLFRIKSFNYQNKKNSIYNYRGNRVNAEVNYYQKDAT
jgi:hypothetical protein